MKKILKSVAVLTVISIVCAAVLTVANYFWKVEEPVGISAQLLKEFRTLTDDETAEFIELETIGMNINEDITNVYKATAGENANILIVRAKGTAGSYGDVIMLTAINTSDDTVIATKKYIDGTSRPADINYDIAKGLDNAALQEIEFDIKSGATLTSKALAYALKLSMEEYVANKKEILAAREKSYELLTVNVTTEKALEDIEAGKSAVILIEVISTNLRKANPDKVNFEFTLTRGGKSITAPQKVEKVTLEDDEKNEGNKVIYSVTIRNLTVEKYKLDVKASYKKVSASGTLEFTPISLEEQVIKRMFEGTESVELLDTDEESKVITYKNNLDNYVFAIRNYDYDYEYEGGSGTWQTNLFIAFDENNKIFKVDGKVTHSVPEGFDLNKYLEAFVGKDVNDFAGYENPDEIDLDIISGATYTSNAIKLSVAKICTYYDSIENINDYLSSLGA